MLGKEKKQLGTAGGLGATQSGWGRVRGPIAGALGLLRGEMLGNRTLRLQHGNRIEALCVLGTHTSADVYG